MSTHLIASGHSLSGIFLHREQAQTLKMVAHTPPQAVAWTYSQEHLHELVAALHTPATTAYARCEAVDRQRDQSLIAVPFSALKPSLHFALDCIYLFQREDVPAPFTRHSIPYELIPFTQPSSSEGTFIKVPLQIAPPWDALAPSALCCVELLPRLELLRQVLPPETVLEPVQLLVENRDPVYKRYRAAPLHAFQADARHQLLRMNLFHFYCLYDSTLSTHPLLQPLHRRFELCRMGHEQ